MTHAALRELVSTTDLRRFGMQPGVRVGLALPNGPDMAAALLLCVATCACVPVNR